MSLTLPHKNSNDIPERALCSSLFKNIIKIVFIKIKNTQLKIYFRHLPVSIIEIVFSSDI